MFVQYCYLKLPLPCTLAHVYMLKSSTRFICDPNQLKYWRCHCLRMVSLKCESCQVTWKGLCMQSASGRKGPWTTSRLPNSFSPWVPHQVGSWPATSSSLLLCDLSCNGIGKCRFVSEDCGVTDVDCEERLHCCSAQCTRLRCAVLEICTGRASLVNGFMELKMKGWFSAFLGKTHLPLDYAFKFWFIITIVISTDNHNSNCHLLFPCNFMPSPPTGCFLHPVQKKRISHLLMQNPTNTCLKNNKYFTDSLSKVNNSPHPWSSVVANEWR